MALRASRTSLIDKNIMRPKGDVNIGTFGLLFSEMVQYANSKSLTTQEIPKKLSEMGYHVGIRMLDLVYLREKNFKRETRLRNMLLFLKGPFWKCVFGKEADELEQSTENEREYYLIEREPVVNKYISVPTKDLGNLNCAAFIAGIVEAALTSSGFACQVTAITHKGTTYIIKFDAEVVNRDRLVEGR